MDRMTKKLERAYFRALKAVASSRIAAGREKGEHYDPQMARRGKVPKHLRATMPAHAMQVAKEDLAFRKKVPFSNVAQQYKPGAEPKISAEADELLLYADNDEPTYRQVQMIRQNLAKKMRDGLYSHSMAPKAWVHAADSASARYKKEIGTEGIDFQHRGSGAYAHNAATRREVANYMTWRFVRWAQGGDYDREDWTGGEKSKSS